MAESIVFDAEFTANDFKLFDLPAAVMETVRAGDSVCFKGRGDGEVVLCSSSATYAVRKVESSNTTLVLPSTSGGAFCEPRVVGSIDCTYEVERTTPFLTDLRDMLEERPYTESDADDAVSGSTGQLYTLADLVAGTRASEGEIATALRRMGADEIGGHIRIVEKALLAYTFDLVLSLAEEKGWDLGAVSVGACCTELGDSPPFAIARAVALHGDVRLPRVVPSLPPARPLARPPTRRRPRWRARALADARSSSHRTAPPPPPHHRAACARRADGPLGAGRTQGCDLRCAPAAARAAFRTRPVAHFEICRRVAR